MCDNNNIYVARCIHFRPYAETGEFACIGVIMYSLSSGYFNYKLAHKASKRKLSSRIHGFFPELSTCIFTNSVNYIEVELEKVRQLSRQPEFFTSIESQIRNLCRERENIIQFGTSFILKCDNPDIELDRQFDSLVMRGFIDNKPTYLEEMSASIRNQLAQASVPSKSKTLHLQYNSTVTLPFWIESTTSPRAIKPLDMKKSVNEVIADSLQWNYQSKEIKELNPDVSLFCPIRYPDRDNSAFEAVNDIFAPNDTFEVCSLDDPFWMTRTISFASKA